jgi:hypothetical protein
MFVVLKQQYNSSCKLAVKQSYLLTILYQFEHYFGFLAWLWPQLLGQFIDSLQIYAIGSIF